MAVAKPSKLPIWDINATNIVEPQSTNQSDGWQVDANGIPQKPPFQYHNYMWNLQYKWFAYLDDKNTAQDTLIAGKALLQGDNTKTFKVADAVNTDEAVSKGQSDAALVLKANITSLKEIGVGQTWQDVTASRAFGVTYTNNTSKPIVATITGYNTSTTYSMVFMVDGISFTFAGDSDAGLNLYGNKGGVTQLIPSSSTYSLSGGNLIIEKWIELR